MKLATLGPKGTFSHEAALKYDKKSSVVFEKTVWDIFEAVRSKKTDRGIVPLENSVSGTISATVDSLMDFNLKIQKEVIVPVRHNLASKVPLNKIKIIFSTIQAYEQCEQYVRKNCPNAEISYMNTNAVSAEKLYSSKGSVAAIVPALAAELYKLKVIAESIQDSKFNVTRFIVIGREETKKTGHDRTSISIYPQVDKPGLLYSLLGEFAKRKINLSKIESRPAKGKLGDYIFFIDLIGHRDDKDVKEAFKSIEKSFFLKVLGSYPREY